MGTNGGIILCLAYITGLFTTSLAQKMYGLPAGGVGLMGMGVVSSILLPQLWKRGPTRGIWLAAGLVGFAATIYFQWRLPQPGEMDISRFLTPSGEQSSVSVSIDGTISSTPRLTRSQRVQFLLTTARYREMTTNESLMNAGKTVTGELYVTVPLLLGTGLSPGQQVQVVGTLFQPKPALNPGGFDFKAYLAQEGCFAGMNAHQITIQKTPWGWWILRQRILRSQVWGLGSPEGPLLSAMVLGGRVIDLPFHLKDQFAQIGLSHALAASGFQVSLVLGVILAVTQRWGRGVQFYAGVLALLILVGLTGIQPSILRAAIMGFGALLALLHRRRTKSAESLILTATILVFINPVWIWDLGFEFSFLATLGLLVTVPPIMETLNWLPPLLNSAFAVPIAAYVWTLPLQLYNFGLVSPYSIPVNILVTPLIAILSLGGMLSALLSLLYSPLGSALAWMLFYPCHWLIQLVQYCQELPGSAISVGTLPLVQLIGIYTLFGLVWIIGFMKESIGLTTAPFMDGKECTSQTIPASDPLGTILSGTPTSFFISLVRRTHLFLTLIILSSLVIGMVVQWQSRTSLIQITILSAGTIPVAIVQDQGRVAVMNSGDPKTVHLTVLPFLRRQAINRFNWAIATLSTPQLTQGWRLLLNQLSTQFFYDVPNQSPHPNQLNEPLIQLIKRKGRYQVTTQGQPLQVGTMRLRLLSKVPSVWQFQMQGETWLWLDRINEMEQRQLVSQKIVPNSRILWWSGVKLIPELIDQVRPQWAIATNPIDLQLAEELRKRGIVVFSSAEAGAIRWIPKKGLEPLSGDNFIDR
jgi:competence protein ComEC